MRFEEALADALCRISVMNSVGDRNDFVRHLSESVVGLPDIAEHPVRRRHAIEIIFVCRRHPGGLYGLLSTVRFMAPDEGASLEFERLVESVGVRELVTAVDRQRVLDLLGSVPPVDAKTVKNLWYAAAGDGAPLPDIPITTLAAAFDHLATINAGWDGVPPALAFVEHVARQTAGPAPAELRRWNDRQAQSLGLTDEIARLRRHIEATAPETPAPPCLVIKIEPIDSRKFMVS